LIKAMKVNEPIFFFRHNNGDACHRNPNITNEQSGIRRKVSVVKQKKRQSFECRKNYFQSKERLFFNE